MGIALKILLIGIIVICICIFYSHIKKTKFSNHTEGYSLVIPLILIMFLIPYGFVFGFVLDVLNQQLSLTMKIIEGVLLLIGYMLVRAMNS